MSNYNLNSLSTNNNRKSAKQEQRLYQHLQDLARQQNPEESIGNFRTLFIDASGYFIPEIWEAMETIIDADPDEEEFHNILNRSCYILINRWLQNPQLQKSIPELVSIFQVKPNKLPSCWTSKRVRTLIRSFTETEKYVALQRLAKMFIRETQENTKIVDRKLEKLIDRYPYLYEHCFLNDESTDEEQQKIKMIRRKQQQKYEIDLSKYITYQRLPRKSNSVENPTLMKNEELNEAVKYFTKKVHGSQTLRDQAQQFKTYCDFTGSYGTFKDGLYEYLTDTIDHGYSKRQFNHKLYNKLQNTWSDNNTQKPNDSLILGTCKKMLDFLVVESIEQPKHFVFYDLINNLGETMAIGMLLKIVLFCHQAKPYLEQKFSILFNHYQGATTGKVWWLVKSMETLNVAFSTNLGGINRCCF
ncbi:MAG: hypothetical protein F6K23_20980 [Okeania sp. SIO2C9]|uniref:hypothetical protein n=1 Tax=Okeania sp. SIO2C9 TaxID=2607791 RepID=UPI0013BED896|nr:hypothetical protein [Okeania sp. SIO2C9]NEQ75301.1 hypothetical protein [Okeania sp. SIO2C9]